MKSKKSGALRTAAGCALVCAAIIADSTYRLVTTEYTITDSDLPESFEGFRIVQLSDLHAACFGEKNTRLVSAVEREDPDIIVLTGDFIEDEDDLPLISDLTEKLKTIAPVYFVSGNHDWASAAIKRLFGTMEDAGAVCLRNECTTIDRDGDIVVLCGVDDPNGPRDMIQPNELVDIIEKESPGSYRILLAHRNDYAKKYPNLKVNIIFCGHGHGGIVRLPFLGGVFGTDMRFFPQYDAGVFDCGYKMVVSRGLGPASLAPRFLNNPEIVCVTLSRG